MPLTVSSTTVSLHRAYDGVRTPALATWPPTRRASAQNQPRAPGLLEPGLPWQLPSSPRALPAPSPATVTAMAGRAATAVRASPGRPFPSKLAPSSPSPSPSPLAYKRPARPFSRAQGTRATTTMAGLRRSSVDNPIHHPSAPTETLNGFLSER